ncbi:hypothetical protein DERF_011464 [Dermatophagoides farinae]|uniref:Uncharacterized protein n=1 Tax=Dermatophagoides farinae TaxID=6954 RepID=A0A922HX70_DERFA|nr:hypothetical protein DERF_011464 [Dermatophagoides farinae]
MKKILMILSIEKSETLKPISTIRIGFLFLCDHRHHHHQYFYSSETNQIKIVVTNEKNAIMIIVIR